MKGAQTFKHYIQTLIAKCICLKEPLKVLFILRL